MPKKTGVRNNGSRSYFHYTRRYHLQASHGDSGMNVVIELIVAYKELAVENFFSAVEAIKETWSNS